LSPAEDAEPKRMIGLRLSLLYAACFAGIGIYMPYFPVWLEHRGLDAPTIGLILALPMVIRILVTAPLMTLADCPLRVRRLLLLTGSVQAVLYAALFLADGPLAIAGLVIALAVTQAPTVPASDLVATEAVRDNARLAYGRLRLWGSAAFLAFNVAGGYFLSVTTPGAIVWLLAGLSLVFIAVVWMVLPAPSDTPGRHTAPGPARISSGFPVALWYVFGAAALVQASHAGLYGFSTLHWRGQGFSDGVIGWLWATGVIAEIVLFALYGPIRSASVAIRLIMLGGAAAMLRFGAMAFAPGGAASFGLQILHGLSFGATHLGAMAALSQLAPAGARGRAQGIISTGAALTMAAGTVLSGWAFQAFGSGVFAGMVPFAGAGLVLALLALRSLPSQPQREGEGG
jgi:PPP family 3-phenylpropionic acid transporter